ncbi:uroporphyrinogen decarboxylase [Rhizobium leguminosarum]|uniref:uroporphyrinogen decarboxylase n=1 Tax=Rhizobium TaxID=379 RepID=UPI0010323289|nr:uroporphyrinogen decarboxylase [Rhizobium leguminosarum]TBF87444.1 uroporphyrinogen decarboxylase [Rhizobium leguminosarum]TBG07057.1 uroporphyrinogen decarboxylase [Rhizobium leguminosarum]TBG07791.1 uroporphyrinogen decarboxylase [Rhizobium leguminosarum]TBG30748.1 uroporphyrinogen decarboxylase [Rhizobium leguminosarum]TBG50090.1 uroporphyrinogen decarboxylase [Rhizobium leguminosarum]
MSVKVQKIMRVLDGETVSPPPLWLMRQAGRHLPEYKETSARAGGFLNICYSPDLAVEVTLQPIRRYGFDAAILFSDILVIPDALKRNVRFVEGHGPELDPIGEADIARLEGHDVLTFLKPVLEAVRRLRAELSPDMTLLGFCGAPWTIATYMIAGRSTPDQAPARLFAYQHRAALERLLDLIADISADYLVAQIDAGADAVQIFDTWAGILDDVEFEVFAVQPMARMIASVKSRRPAARIIAFAKGAGYRLTTYRQKTRADAIGLDWTVPLQMARELQKEGPVQGNLDPMRLVAGGQPLEDGIDRILQALGSGPLIFNLGHGVTPQTNTDHVHHLIRRVRELSSV